jgi:hypothetical protein
MLSDGFRTKDDGEDSVMSIPAYLNSNFYYHELFAVNNVDDIFDWILTKMALESPSWTLTDNRPGTASISLKSPTDVDGRWFSFDIVDQTVTTTSKLEIVGHDMAGTTFHAKRALFVNTYSVNCLLFHGQFHFHLDVCRSDSNWEHISAGALDQSPEANTINMGHFMWTHGQRTSADSVIYHTADYAVMIDNAASAESTSRVGTGEGQSTSSTGEMTETGWQNAYSANFYCKDTGGSSYIWAGRPYQYYSISGSYARGARLTVPIDVGVTGVFQRAGTSQAANSIRTRWYRVA